MSFKLILTSIAELCDETTLRAKRADYNIDN